MRRPKSRHFRKKQQLLEEEEIELLDSWIQSQKPDSGSNPMSLPPLGSNAPLGRLDEESFSRYAGATRFQQLPISQKTKDGLRQSKYIKMTDVQRASLPHALCGRDVIGASKTGSGKTLSFIIPVLEKLYRERWGTEDGVGSIIMSPTRELCGQLFDVLKSVGKHHNFSAGLLIGGGEDIDTEKEHVNDLNILVCTPRRLLQHMNETLNFDCSQLQVLVLDEADRILDNKFQTDLNAIISQLPKCRQTLLFSATQTKSIQDITRLSLKDPEYVSVHDKSAEATPIRLCQTAIIVPLDQKLDMLLSFIKSHRNAKVLVFLSSCKQVKFVFEVFKKLQPGIPLKCLHGRMKQEKRMGIYSQFCKKDSVSVLFSTDVASRGLDFNKVVDWVVQVDCPEDVESYIHRVGRTARFSSAGKSILFVMPSEQKILENLQEAKVPIKPRKVNTKTLQPVSGLLSSILIKHPNIQHLAQRAFITYLRSIHVKKDKEIFDVKKLPIDEFSASLGLPMTPKIRFLDPKIRNKPVAGKSSLPESYTSDKENLLENHCEEDPIEKVDLNDLWVDEDEGFILTEDTPNLGDVKTPEIEDIRLASKVSKKKKKINPHRPLGTRVVFDDECNELPPLAKIADADSGNASFFVDQKKKAENYKRMREELMQADKEDKLVQRQRHREKRIKQKRKWKGGNTEDDNVDDLAGSEGEGTRDRLHKNAKIYFDSDDDNAERKEVTDKSISVHEQEELALKLLNSMHS
ncbi:RNA helicase [Quillaja saponaria]|uniref:ATP-dependent RNA helicase n=1 Tax=Quillaja saponaria TaxID=32244 RepID=A0AAD7KPC2_QUISA|nr:RNA helicase [Quillaja saponaria]